MTLIASSHKARAGFLVPALSLGLVAVGCSDGGSGSGKTVRAVERLSDDSAKAREKAEALDQQVKDKKGADAKRIADLEKSLATLRAQVDAKADSKTLAELEKQIADARGKSDKELADLRAKLSSLREFATGLEAKVLEKIRQGGLVQTNAELIRETMEGHTPTYELKGDYNTLVIPVEFEADESFDGRLADRDYFTDGKAQEELFGKGENSLTSYYRHTSGGKLNVMGTVVAPVKVGKALSYYGKAVQGSNDEQARALVVDAVKKVVEARGDSKEFWRQFDKWDLNDLDGDGNFYEADGFADAVVLVYAGKSQASCQRAMDPEGKRPGTDDIDPADPRRAQKVECFNRIWPHRWSVFLDKENPDAPKKGPTREGREGAAIGYRVNPELHVFDYNMQSEYSDTSTFIHEFGHSLTLPDTYAYSGANNVGEWDIMASNSQDNAQEMSAFNKMTLGWLNPKIVEAGQTTSAYLGQTNFVPAAQRDALSAFGGPLSLSQWIRGATHTYDVVSTVPGNDEAVYRSVMLRTKPTRELVKIVETKASNGSYTAYSGRFDSATKSVKVKLEVPESGDATLSFDTIYHIETETNFLSNDADIKVVTDFDIGFVKVDGETKEELRLVSGDEDYDSLAEKNPDCQALKVLELRNKKIATGLSNDEKKAFAELTAQCQAPVWVKKSYDLSALRGKSVEVEIGLTTDGGYTEFGIFVDNITLGGETIGFENSDQSDAPYGTFKASKDGLEEQITNQFYLFEYRDPGAKLETSFNKDRNINRGGMAMFLPKGDGRETPAERFRVITTSYQPGVVAWYFNGKFDRRSNNPQAEANRGQGYILTVGSKLRELALPGVFSDESLFKDGFYDPSSEAYKALEAAQMNEFKCFGYTEYATYLDGKAPECEGYEQKDFLETITLDGKTLMFSRKSFNDFLPAEQRKHFLVSNPLNALKQAPIYRTALNSFRAPGAKPFAPVKVYKLGSDNKMVIDEALTKSAAKFEPMSEFADAKFGPKAAHLEDPRLTAAVAVVQPKGIVFRVEAPASDVTKQYTDRNPANNAASDRKPLAKLYIGFDAQAAADASQPVINSFVPQSRPQAVHLHGPWCGNHD